ncbi:hypothetical protein BH10BAC2_BH10BAC2_46960 [soil metagenome]
MQSLPNAQVSDTTTDAIITYSPLHYSSLLLLPNKLSINAVASESSKLNNNADHQPSTSKPVQYPPPN